MPASFTALWQRQLWKKQGGDFCFMACRSSVSMQSHLSHPLQTRPRDQTVPKTLNSDGLFGTVHLGSERGSPGCPTATASHQSPSLNDRCRTEHELCCWTSPQRQPLVTITCVSSYVSKLPTPQSTTVPIRWLSRNVQPMVILPIRSFKGFTSRMAE